MDQSWHFLNTGERTGLFNMEFDEQLARDLQAGKNSPTLRLFRWKPWAVSLGYNQNPEDINAAACSRDGIDIVRRPTGGRAILHAEELTYSVVMYSGRRSILEVYNAISEALVHGLGLFGVQVSLQKSQPDFRAQYRQASSIPCFSSSARYEIEWQGRKLVGSAQRRFSDGEHDVVLQHGSILCGGAHQRLPDYLAVSDEAIVRTVRADLQRKTADLAGILGVFPDMNRLADCIRKGFEESWHVAFHEGKTA